ncbi:12604_t:CDS:1, partial [Entrophospora sp. SA101]
LLAHDHEIVKAKNLNNLTSEQLTKLISRIKEKKIIIDSFKGIVLMDLLAYVNKLVRNGNTQHAHISH